MRIVANPRGTLPPRLRLSCARTVPSAAARYDLTARRPKLWPGPRNYSQQRIGGRPAGCFNHASRRRDKSRHGEAGGAVLPAESGRQTGEQRPDRPNNQSDHGLCHVCVSPPPPWARRSCCRRRPRYWLKARTPRPAPGPQTATPTPRRTASGSSTSLPRPPSSWAGPAAHPECVWLGRRVVGLMWRDDLDTAFRHLDLYDRFGCPAGHIQATFRCLVRQGNIDPKPPDTLARTGPHLLGQSRTSKQHRSADVSRRAGRDDQPLVCTDVQTTRLRLPGTILLQCCCRLGFAVTADYLIAIPLAKLPLRRSWVTLGDGLGPRFLPAWL